jgi:hypothetical protein
MGQDTVVSIATCYGLDGLGSNPSGGEIFRTHPDQPWDPPSLLYNGYWVGLGVNLPPSSSKLKERVALYIYALLGFQGLF